jgi:Ca2+-transporting ATPase
VLLIALWRGQSESDARALVFTTLIIANLFLIFLSRSSQKTLIGKLISTKNHVVEWIAIGTFLLLTIVLYIPSFREVLHFSFLHGVDLAICATVGVLSVIWSQLLPQKWLEPSSTKPRRRQYV